MFPYSSFAMETVYQLSASNVENDIERLEMHSTDPIREWVSYPEAEQYCGLSHTTLWRHVAARNIRAARVGRSTDSDGNFRTGN